MTSDTTPSPADTLFALIYGTHDQRSLRELGYPAARAAEGTRPRTEQEIRTLHAFAAALQHALTAVEQALSTGRS
ncbi:hypothetical protein KO481_16970 [Nocardia sp. NEAU-G5]|uniref:Uncharacterized protein n=1 Tax=Nocardia albiluteola TaxID=2842303 RepID=A0ABS6AYU5_9NOCA|nr:hypothetical protein [Nocardia albiluteola]MBU3063214.1 hypothetical protein [Nocardia albiluteola]